MVYLEREKPRLGWLNDSGKAISGGRKKGSPKETSCGDPKHKGRIVGLENSREKIGRVRKSRSKAMKS